MVQQKDPKTVPEIKEQGYREVSSYELARPGTERKREDMITIFNFLYQSDNVNCEQFFKIIEGKSKEHTKKLSNNQVKIYVNYF